MTRVIGEGEPCCGRPSERRGHPEGWTPAPGQHYLEWWDTCLKCGRMVTSKAAIGPMEIPRTALDDMFE